MRAAITAFLTVVPFIVGATVAVNLLDASQPVALAILAVVFIPSVLYILMRIDQAGAGPGPATGPRDRGARAH